MFYIDLGDGEQEIQTSFFACIAPVMKKYLLSCNNNINSLDCGAIVTSPQVQIGLYYTNNWTLDIAMCGRRCCRFIFTATLSSLSFAQASPKSFFNWVICIVAELLSHLSPAIGTACHPRFPPGLRLSRAHTRVSQFPITFCVTTAFDNTDLYWFLIFK